MQNFEELGYVKVTDLIMTPQLVFVQTDSEGGNQKYLGLDDVWTYLSIRAVAIKDDSENNGNNLYTEYDVESCSSS